MACAKITSIVLLAASAALGQAPSPVQQGVTSMPGPQPLFRVDVTSRTTTAVNYHSRQGTTKIDFEGTALMPQARGEANVTANTGATRISLHFDHLSNPAQFGPEFQTLVLWAITPEGRAERLGEVTLKHPDDKSAGLYATTDLQTFGMIVTAEPYFSVSQPSDVVVMENFTKGETSGTLEHIDAKYELLKRGVYTLNINSTALAPITSDINTPLQLREAREAIAIAKAQGADTYAPDIMQKVAMNMVNAEGYYRSHQQKELDTVAREATQMAEDARRVSIEKERAQVEQATRDSATRAQQEAAEAQANATREAQLRAQAEAEKAAAQQQTQQAQIAMANARQAQQDAEAARQAAEAARQAAIAEQQKLAAEKEAALAQKSAAENDARALRERLRTQLNLILETADNARGLIVNMSDVLFDFGQATLKPGAREKLAKISGILLAYPGLQLAIEGHTDSIGSDEFNLGLSTRRAEAVRDYLVSNGINRSNTSAIGLGKAGAVASNDTDAGRQQNRRVELIVSGDMIGQPVTKTPVTPPNN